MARCAFTEVRTASGRHLSAAALRRNKNRIAGIIFSMISLTVIYSFLAVEAFVNYQLYRIWRRRNGTDLSALRFRERFGEVPRFEDLRLTDVRELAERVKALCYLLGYAKVHEKNPRGWQDFKSLLKQARHFLVHPIPDPERFQAALATMLTKTPVGTYVRAAQGIIGHFYAEGHLVEPRWLQANEIMQFGGVELLPERRAQRSAV